MGDAKHTPGPWVVGPVHDAVCAEPDRDGWTVVASNPHPRSPRGASLRRQWEANARLIAAAPELYEALSALSEEVDIPDFCTPELRARLDRAHAALAKASQG